MRFILEHPWLAFISIAAVGIALMWIGLRDGKRLLNKIGLGVFFFAVIACITGLIIVTPTEHAKNVIYTFVNAAEKEEYERLSGVLDRNVVLVDHWNELPNNGVDSIQKNLAKFHQKHTMQFNVIMRFIPIEREGDVLVEISLLSRVSGIGTVPSTWRLIVSPSVEGKWKITSIDAIEIMGKSYR